MPEVEVTRHLIFTGNPGTGKTTVARLIGELYKSYGLLERGHLVEVSRSDLVAQYVGHTAVKTTEKFVEALGGVLFIDEAYALSRQRNAEWDFGIEAIDTLVKLMEDHRAELIVIVAGYSEEMQTFVSSNPGFRGRFRRELHFPDYSDEQLVEIFLGICRKNGYDVSPDGARALAARLATTARSRHFANARAIRSVFEEAAMRQAIRLSGVDQPSLDDLRRLVVDDLREVHQE